MKSIYEHIKTATNVKTLYDGIRQILRANLLHYPEDYEIKHIQRLADRKAEQLEAQEKNIKLYTNRKEAARAAAIAYQEQAAERAQTYAEAEAARRKFEKLARRFGLVREFRGNGII